MAHWDSSSADSLQAWPASDRIIKHVICPSVCWECAVSVTPSETGTTRVIANTDNPSCSFNILCRLLSLSEIANSFSVLFYKGKDRNYFIHAGF